MQFLNGIVHEGQWVEGELTGPGKVIYPDGRTLEGEFREGRPWNAKGTQQYPSGDVEEGQWVEGRLSGPCKRYLSDGSVEEGEYAQGDLVPRGVSYAPTSLMW
jgi:hypothetical protein